MPTTSAAQKNHPDRIIIVEEQNIVQKIGGRAEFPHRAFIAPWKTPLRMLVWGATFSGGSMDLVR